MWVVGEGGSVGAPAFSSGGTSPTVCISAQCGLLEAKALWGIVPTADSPGGVRPHTQPGQGVQKQFSAICCLIWFSFMGIPTGSQVKNPPSNAGDTGLIRELRWSPGEGNGNPLQYSCLGNSTDSGAWRATAHGVKESRHDSATKEQTSRLRGWWAHTKSMVGSFNGSQPWFKSDAPGLSWWSSA